MGRLWPSSFLRDTLNVLESLAFITFLHIFLCILLHGWPVVACFDDFANQGSQAYVVSTDFFLDLL